MAIAKFPWVVKSKSKYTRCSSKKNALAKARKWRKNGAKNVTVYKLRG